MNKLGTILGIAYEPLYREHFKNHPNGDEIVSKLVQGKLTSEEIEEVFMEAENFNYQKFLEMTRKTSVDGKKSFTLRLVTDNG
jgi:hypothetical protein